MKKAFLGIAAVSILVILVLVVVKVTGSTSKGGETTEVTNECCADGQTTSCCDSDSEPIGTATADCEKAGCDKTQTECANTETATAVTESASKKECTATCTGH